MKKIFLTALIFLVLAMPCYGAGSYLKVTNDALNSNRATNQIINRVLTLVFVGEDGTGAVPSLTLNPTGWTDGTYSGYFTYPLLGWDLYKLEIDCNHAGTEPTEDSEIYIYQNGIDLLDGNGVNAIDNSAERQIYFQTDSLPMTQPIISSLTVTVTQQAAATASATGTIYIIMKPSK